MRFLPFSSFFFFVPFFLISFGLNVSGQCLDDQRLLLLQLKDELQLEYYSVSDSEKLNSWNLSTDCCVNWGGVKCDSLGRVTHIDLNSEYISGGIGSLFSLQFLQSLNLAYNFFYSTEIPPQINHLPSLTYLNLSYSEFVGQIPTELSQLTRLITLDLSADVSTNGFNYGGIEISIGLKRLVQNLTELTELYLDGVQISEQGYEWGKAISSGLPNLRVLSLPRCNLSGAIDSSLANLQFLSVIRLDYNNIFSHVPESIADFQNLTSLSLINCNLTGELPKRIFRVQTLKFLDLSENELLGGSLPEFPQTGSLNTLLLTHTNFSGPLPNSIGNLRMLPRLDLSGGNFSGEIPSSVANLTQLTYLDLSSNMFSGQLSPTLFQGFMNLELIDLSLNHFNGQLSPILFQGLKNLKYIDLSSNSFSGKIPLALFSIPSLQEIFLANNHFDGTLSEIPNASSSLLELIDLNNNNLTGEIPSSFFYLSRLDYLDLSSNNLNGTLKLANVSKLVNLAHLGLSYNNLSTETRGDNSSNVSFPWLPTFSYQRNQSRLQSIDLSSNQISGEIPNWIWGNGSLASLNLSCNRLEKIQEPYGSVGSLDLHSNNLKGKLPIPSKSFFYSGGYLDYSSNNFSSSMPFDIGDYLGYVQFFSIAHNNISGAIPNSICKALGLQVLDMSDNSLNGTFPLCLTERRDELAVLNLGKNHLTGNISGRFQKNCGLQTLDLNGNRLEGKIPESLANCTSLELLNLGNNRINDVFPRFLKNSTNLRVLVLRSNMFYGGIGCSGIIEMNWQNLQIIDLASNNFSGPLIPNFFLKLKGMMYERPMANFLNIIQGTLYYHYQVTVTVTNKGNEMLLVKVISIFTLIDFSLNKFEGEIPEAIGELKSLHFLNLSHNSFSNSIPSSFGNLKQLESLDLAGNNLSGIIPTQLSGLTFLSFMNLSHNRLTGRIPTGTQIQSLPESSFEGNDGLCGAPLNCSKDMPIVENKRTESKSDHTNWEMLCGAGIGYAVGLGFVIVPLFFFKRWSEMYWKCVHRVSLFIVTDNYMRKRKGN